MAEWLGDRLGGRGGGFSGKGKNGCLEVINSGWVGAWGDHSLMKDFEDFGPVSRACCG